MFLNRDQLEKQLDKEEFQEIGSMAAFKVLETQFQMFIKSRFYLDDEYVDMDMKQIPTITRLGYSRNSVTHCSNTMESVKKSIGERARQHKKLEYEKQDPYMLKSKAEIQKKGFAIAALKNELRKLTVNSVNIKFAKPSILGKPVGQPLKNQSVVRQPTAFKSERTDEKQPRVIPLLVLADHRFKELSSEVKARAKHLSSEVYIEGKLRLRMVLCDVIVQLILFIVDSGCTKHMTGNLKLLCNFVEKFLGTVRFGNVQMVSAENNTLGLVPQCSKDV
ncbi:hypothetical protein Tco_1284009 [Tanacetum coccineum]